MNPIFEAGRQIGQFLHPRTLKVLRNAGATSPKSPLAFIGAMPWLFGRGPSLGVVSQMNAIVLGDKPALHDRNGTVTFKELEARANQATHLLRRAGIEPGDKVGLLLRNGREMLELILACQKLGVTVCPFNTWAKTKELKNTIDNANVKLLVYDTKHTEQVQACVPQDVPLYWVGDEDDAAGDSEPYESVLSEQVTVPPGPLTLHRGSPRIVIHTSGTTGTPKGAQRSASQAGMGTLANLMSIVPYRRDDVLVCPAPLFHSFGLVSATVATAIGMTLVLPEKFDPETTLQLVDEHDATALSLVPVMIRRIVTLDDEVKNRYDISSLRILLASGSAISEDLRRASMEVFGDVLYDLYGSTEIGWVTIASPQDIKEHPRTVGKPVPGIEVAVFDDDGNKLEPNEIGELYIKSKFVFEGYTSGDNKKVVDGYMTIGDVGRLDEDGYMFIEGRADDMVIVGGENIYPIEIEGVIEDMDGVSEVAVLGIPDDEYGQILAAFVVGNVDEDQIDKVCRSELASYKVPKRIEVVDELPRNATGKVLKRELVKIAQGDSSEASGEAEA